MEPWLRSHTCQQERLALAMAVVLFGLLTNSVRTAQPHSHLLRSGHSDEHAHTKTPRVISSVPHDQSEEVRSGFGRRLRSLLENQTAAEDEDRRSLLQFKFELANGNALLRGWSSVAASACDWMGVTCSDGKRGRVIGLNLSGSGLRGRIDLSSASLGGLGSLVRLDLSNNFLSGGIPPSLGNLSYLKYMSLSYNNFTGEIPSEFGRLPELRDLYLDHNLLSGVFPASILNCSSLTVLELWQNNLEGNLPVDLGLLQNLEKLDLFENRFSGKIPVSLLTNCTNLLTLVLGRNQFQRAEIPAEIGRFHKLEELILDSNQFTGKIPATLFNCSNLTLFSAYDNELEGDIPWELGQLKKLEALSLSENMFTNLIPPSLANCSSMQFLYLGSGDGPGPDHHQPFPDWVGLWGNLSEISVIFLGLNGTIPSSLFNCTKLGFLSFFGNNMTGTLPPEIGNFSRLFRLQVGWNQLSGEVPNSIAMLSNLQYVFLHDNLFYGSFPLFTSNLSASPLSSVRIEISRNHFGGIIPSDIDRRFPNLSWLGMGYNNFEGDLPASIGSLSLLTWLVVMGNKLTGTIPSSIGNLTSLGRLQLDQNYFRGIVPIEIFLGCSKLYLLTMSFNSLGGTLPEEIGQLSVLNILDLAGNEFSGSIPRSVRNMLALVSISLSLNNFSCNLSTLGSFLPSSLSTANLSHNRFYGSLTPLSYLETIQVLDVSFNLLSGAIPPDLGECKDLGELDFSSNNFSGAIPSSLDRLVQLRKLNVSNNDLEGSIPTSGVFSTLNLTGASFAGNPRLCGAVIRKPCPNPSSSHGSSSASSPPCQGNCKRAILIGSIITGVFFLIVFSILWVRRRPISIANPDIVATRGIVNLSPQTLGEATNGFSADSVIGEGTGTVVYKATLADGKIYAAKVLRSLPFPIQNQNDGGNRSDADEALVEKHFSREVETLSKLRHRNVLKIVGFCSTVDFKAMILEFMCNGSLHHRLHEREANALSLHVRLDIIRGIASGLIYLHDDFPQPIIHRDINPTNILLDSNMVPKISDFGLGKFVRNRMFVDSGGEGSATIAMGGTIGYIPPEYSSSSIATTKGDVYSFGVTVLELVTGRRPDDDTFSEHGGSLATWVSSGVAEPVRIADPSIIEELEGDSDHLKRVQLVVQIGLLCCRVLPRTRPHMREVQEMLHSVAEIGTVGPVHPSIFDLANAART